MGAQCCGQLSSVLIPFLIVSVGVYVNVVTYPSEFCCLRTLQMQIHTTRACLSRWSVCLGHIIVSCEHNPGQKWH